MARQPSATKARKNHEDATIAVGIAIRPNNCVIRYAKNGEVQPDKTYPFARSIDCSQLLHDKLKEIGNDKITSCVFSMFGDVDSDAKEFLSSGVGMADEQATDWQQKIEFWKYHARVADNNPDAIEVFNDATLAAYSLLRDRSAKSPYPYLLILIKEWGIGFGLVHKGYPFSFGRSFELAHIPALQQTFPGDIVDDARSACALHNSQTVPCISGLACINGSNSRSPTLRNALRNAVGGDGYEFEALYLAQACVAGAAAYSPAEIVLSGQYMNNDRLQRVRLWFAYLSQGFPYRDNSKEFLSYAPMDDKADIAGAFLRAQDKIKRGRK